MTCWLAGSCTEPAAVVHGAELDGCGFGGEKGALDGWRAVGMNCWLAGSSTESAEMSATELDGCGFGDKEGALDGHGRAKGHGFGDKEGALKQGCCPEVLVDPCSGSVALLKSNPAKRRQLNSR